MEKNLNFGLPKVVVFGGETGDGGEGMWLRRGSPKRSDGGGGSSLAKLKTVNRKLNKKEEQNHLSRVNHPRKIRLNTYEIQPDVKLREEGEAAGRVAFFRHIKGGGCGRETSVTR